MKTFTTIFLLAAAIFVKFTSSAADVHRVSPSPLELVLNCDEVFFATTTNFLSSDIVEFNTASNISLEVSFRNIGEKWMRPNDLPLGLSVVWDGKKYKLTQPEHFFMYDGGPFAPKTGWHRSFLLSDFVIPPEVLASGRHTVAVKDELSESNTFTFSAPHGAIFSKSNKQIFAESSTLTVFIR